MTNGALFDLYALGFAALIGLVILGVAALAACLSKGEVEPGPEPEQPSHVRIIGDRHVR
jgi:hypothetical protein